MHSVGYRNSSNVIAPHVIPIAEKDCYLAEEATPLNCKSTSIARHQRRSYYTERASGKGLALTWLKSWWLPPHLMHPTKPPDCIYVEKNPEQCCLGYRDSQEDWDCYSATKWFEKEKKGRRGRRKQKFRAMVEEAQVLVAFEIFFFSFVLKNFWLSETF